MASDKTFLKLKLAWRLRSGVAIVAGMTMLAGCSSSSDLADPGEWFSGDDAPESTAQTSDSEQAEPAEGFPNLSSVPGEAPATSSSADRESLSEGLNADRSNARYSDQPLTAESTLIPPAPPPPSAVRRPAAPATPVPAAPAAPSVTPRAAAPAAPAAPAAQAATAPAAAPPPPPPTPAAPGTTAQSATSSSTAAAPAPRQSTAPAAGSGSELPPAFPARSASNTPSNYVPPTFEPPRYQLPGSNGGSAAPATQQAARPQVPGVPAGTASATAGQLTAVIYFGHGSSSLDGNDMKVLRDVVAIQRQNNARIVVVGHSSSRTGSTDAVNHRVANLETSLKRANSVAAALARLGVPKSQVVAEARSDNQPVFHEFMPTGEAGNRRAEIYLAY